MFDLMYELYGAYIARYLQVALISDAEFTSDIPEIGKASQKDCTNGTGKKNLTRLTRIRYVKKEFAEYILEFIYLLGAFEIVNDLLETLGNRSSQSDLEIRDLGCKKCGYFSGM